MNKIKTGILGATGTVGQRFVQLLQGHPWFQRAGLMERSAAGRSQPRCPQQSKT
jgi:aspartate-semialdehyde dehydrogenase